MKLGAKITALGFWAGWAFLWLIPEPIVAWAFKVSADLCWRLKFRGVRQLELNLSRVLNLPASSTQIRALSRNGMRRYLRYYYEIFLLTRWSRDEIRSRVRVENDDAVIEALKSGGVILTLPHSGNWDLAGAWAALNYSKVATVAERLKPELVFRKFLEMRTALGMNILPLTGEAGIYEFLRSEVVAGHVVPLLGDRDVAKNGMGNQFFGARATLPIGAAVLAIDTGRPLFTCSTWYDGQMLVITFDEQVSVSNAQVTGRDRLKLAQQVSAEVASRFEQHISAHPEDWHMLQPVWADLVVD